MLYEYVQELKVNLVIDRRRYNEYSFNDKRSMYVMDTILKIFELYHANHTDDEYKIFEAGWLNFLNTLTKRPSYVQPEDEPRPGTPSYSPTSPSYPNPPDSPSYAPTSPSYVPTDVDMAEKTHGIRLLLARLALYA